MARQIWVGDHLCNDVEVAMAFRELHVVEIREVLRLWARGHGIRKVSRQVGLDRKTVRRYVDAARNLGLEVGREDVAVSDVFLADVVAQVQPGRPTVEVGLMRAHCQRHSELIAGWLSDGCRSPKVVRLLHRHTGVNVPLRTLQRFVQCELRPDNTDTVRVVDGPPGVLEIDFLTLGTFEDRDTGKSRTLHALLMVASLSRHQFVWPCLSQTRQDVLEGLEAAWEFFGGVFPIVLPDNPRAIVDKAHAVGPVVNREFVEYMQSRGFEVDLARVRKPKDKARVERQVRFVRDDFFHGERFTSLIETRIAARRWCLEVAGVRIHGRTRRRPLDAFEELDRPVLRPEPKEPYDTPTWAEYQVGRDHAVVVDYALYSVPFRLGTCRLRVRRDRSTVKMYLGAELVKTHPRQPKGGTSIDAVDLPPGKSELATRDTETLCDRAAEHGPHVAAYAHRLAEGPMPWSRMRHVYRLLGLARRHGSEVTDEACARALDLGVIDVKRIQGMLEKGLRRERLLRPTETPPPRGQLLRFQRPQSAFRAGGDHA